MALIGEIVTKITVDDKSLKRDLNKAKKKMFKFRDVAKKALAGIAIGVTGVTAAFGVLLKSVENSSEEIDKLAKTSAKLGIATEELQKLQYQAKLSGVNTDKLNMALQRMVRRVSEAAAGTGEAKNALKELGLNAQALNKLSPDKQFNKIAEAFQNIENQTDKVRLAFKLFDSEGVALVNTLNSDLKGTSKEFDNLGIAITSSQAKAVERFNDAKTKLGTLFDGLKKRIAVELAPVLEKEVNRITEFFKSGGAKKFAIDFAEGVKSAIEGFKKLIAVVGALKDAFKGVFGVIQDGLRSAIDKVLDSGLYTKARNLTSRFIESVANYRPIRFGEAATNGKSGFQDPEAKVKELLRPTPVNKLTEAQKQAKIELLVKTDPGAAVEVLKRDKEVDKIVQTIIREESAKIGR